MKDQLEVFDRLSGAALDLAITFGPRLLVAALILLAGYLVGRWGARMTGRALERLRLEPPVRALVERAVHLLVLGLFLLMALDNLGVELLPLIAGISIAGAGVALAMQGVLSNVVAGLTIIFSRPFRVGDYISIVKEEGEVLDIRLFNTTLGHPDLSRVVIPNRKIVGEILHNYGRMRQIAIEVRVSYGTELPAALSALSQVLQANHRVLQDPQPVIRVIRLDASAIVLVVAPWVQVPDYGSVQGELHEAIIEAFRARGIVIPMPQREVRVLPGGAYLGGQGTQERLAGRDAA